MKNTHAKINVYSPQIRKTFSINKKGTYKTFLRRINSFPTFMHNRSLVAFFACEELGPFHKNPTEDEKGPHPSKACSSRENVCLGPQQPQPTIKADRNLTIKVTSTAALFKCDASYLQV